MRGLWGLSRYIYDSSFAHLFGGRKKGKKSLFFPVKQGIFSLLNRDFKVQLTMRKMPIGLYKIPPCIALLFPKN